MRRTIGIALAFLALLAVPACDPDGGNGAAGSPTPSPSTSPAPTLSAEGFSYTSKDGIRALATFRGDGGTLEVTNATGAEIAVPGVYLFHATTGEVVDAEVAPARPVADGTERAFRVTLSRAMPPGTIGLVVLTVGGDDLGAFLPPAPSGDAA
jgi:hypothetical protein